MCGRVRAQRSKPGDIMAFWTKVGKASGTWGVGMNQTYNARVESLWTYWRDYQRGYIQVDCFWEKDSKIVRVDGLDLKLGVVFNHSMEFAIITREAQGFLKAVHHRMPVILAEGSEQKFLEGGDIIESPIQDLKIAA